jgi:RNA polymerase sigma-70 factor (ECF subfamily)
VEDRIQAEEFLRTRDEAAFRALYRVHSAAMYGLLLRLTGGRTAEAEDALQETWLRAVERLPGFRWESSLRTWLCGIAVRVAMEHARKNPSTGLEPPEPDTAAPSRETAADLRDAVAALADGFRQVLVLHDIEGYTHREIAEMLGIEEGTSKSQLFRARRAIREALAPK